RLLSFGAAGLSLAVICAMEGAGRSSTELEERHVGMAGGRDGGDEDEGEDADGGEDG
ncbi:MAG: hypothetical protein LQ347_002820, partial [Umbilicaria vellea]